MEVKYLDFGSYPIEEVNNSDIINELNNLVNDDNWIDFPYYDNGDDTPFMWYQDIMYNNEKYRGVYFNKIRCLFTNKYGYNREDELRLFPHINIGSVYWFKYCPIQWRILEENKDEIVLISEYILDYMEFYHTKEDRVINNKTIYANNWEYSNIRKWLNDNFYNTAFNESEKELINTKLLDNHNSYNSFSSKYLREQKDTLDKVYLLSYHESLVYFGGWCLSDETKLTTPTKYATMNLLCTEFKPGFKDWLLRTPCNTSSYMVHYVSKGGNIDKENFTFIVEGVRPVINIKK